MWRRRCISDLAGASESSVIDSRAHNVRRSDCRLEPAGSGRSAAFMSQNGTDRSRFRTANCLETTGMISFWSRLHSDCTATLAVTGLSGFGGSLSTALGSDGQTRAALLHARYGNMTQMKTLRPLR
jgi:hypothetical protein